jgi:hypothetical protein
LSHEPCLGVPAAVFVRRRAHRARSTPGAKGGGPSSKLRSVTFPDRGDG